MSGRGIIKSVSILAGGFAVIVGAHQAIGPMDSRSIGVGLLAAFAMSVVDRIWGGRT